MQAFKLEQFMQRLYKKTKNKRIPLRAMMELTYKCNHKCIHCYNPHGSLKPELMTEQVYAIMDEFAAMGTVNMAFTGGEIFMRPDIMDIIFHARDLGMRVSLMTNGSLITEDIADKLIRRGVASFEISFLGDTKEKFDKMTQVEGSFDKVISVVKMLRSKGVIPHIKTCVTNLNIDGVDRIADLARALDISFSYSPLVIPRLDLNQEPGNLRILPEEFLDINKRFARFRKHTARNVSGKRAGKNIKEAPGFWEKECLFDCAVGRTTAFINPYGEMKACITVPEPSFSVTELGVRQCWEKVKEFVDTLKAPADWECLSCDYRDWCSWCPGRGYLNTGNIFGCPPYFRELAKTRKHRYETSLKKDDKEKTV